MDSRTRRRRLFRTRRTESRRGNSSRPKSSSSPPPTSAPPLSTEPPTEEAVWIPEGTVAERILIPITRIDTGTEIEDWIIDERVGEVQGCCVVRAHHRDSDRIRATLKIVTDPDPGARESLIKEGEILFSIRHPNIAQVRNLKLDHSPSFLEFDSLPGNPLDQVLRKKRSLFMAEALDYTEQILSALAYLHQHHVYHLDICPQNMIVRRDGVIKLMGFSHAAETEDLSVALPMTALPYIAPEWPTSSRAATVDLYAVGCMLFEFLTGHTPFGAPLTGCGLTVASVLHAKQSVPFLDPGARFQDDLRVTVRSLTNRDPATRLANANEALTRLQRVERSYAR